MLRFLSLYTTSSRKSKAQSHSNIICTKTEKMKRNNCAWNYTETTARYNSILMNHEN